MVPEDVRYVITLDADTRLPRDTVRRLIGKMAHPLNKPRFDPATGAVVEGYAVLQPRVTPSLPVAREGSRFQRIFSSMNGIDPYGSAISDVYQDLFAQSRRGIAADTEYGKSSELRSTVGSVHMEGFNPLLIWRPDQTGAIRDPIDVGRCLVESNINELGRFQIPSLIDGEILDQRIALGRHLDIAATCWKDQRTLLRA